MPIEIRELTIKTEVRTTNEQMQTKMRAQDVSLLKNEILEACKRMFVLGNKKANYKR